MSDPEPGPRPESESKMEQHLTSAACRPRAFPPTFPTSLMSVDRALNTCNLDCRQDGRGPELWQYPVSIITRSSEPPTCAILRPVPPPKSTLRSQIAMFSLSSLQKLGDVHISRRSAATQSRRGRPWKRRQCCPTTSSPLAQPCPKQQHRSTYKEATNNERIGAN